MFIYTLDVLPGPPPEENVLPCCQGSAAQALHGKDLLALDRSDEAPGEGHGQCSRDLVSGAVSAAAPPAFVVPAQVMSTLATPSCTFASHDSGPESSRPASLKSCTPCWMATLRASTPSPFHRSSRPAHPRGRGRWRGCRRRALRRVLHVWHPPPLGNQSPCLFCIVSSTSIRAKVCAPMNSAAVGAASQQRRPIRSPFS